MIRTVLVPTDFSDHSATALDRAIELARACSARVVLLHSYAVRGSLAAEFHSNVPPDFLEQLRQDARSELEVLAKRPALAGVACETRLSSEPEVDAILEAADELSVDLIAMGANGRGDFAHVLLGSTAERIVRLAPCPVLTVRSPASAAWP